MEPTIFLAAGIALAGGAAVGWWMRGAKHTTERRYVEDILTSKVRLAEDERDEALRELDRKRMQATAERDRLEELEVRSAELAEALQDTDDRLRRTKNQLRTTREELASAAEERHRLTNELDETRATLEAREADVGDGLAELEKKRVLIAELEEELDLCETDIGGLRERIAGLTHDFEEAGHELTRRGGELAELAELTLEIRPLEVCVSEQVAQLEERRIEIERLKEQVADLEPRARKLVTVEEQFAEREKTWKERVGAVEDESMTILTEREREWNDQQRELNETWSERHTAELAEKEREKRTLEQRIKELERLERAWNEERRDWGEELASRESDLERLRAQVEKLEPGLAELEETRNKVSALDVQLGAERTRLAQELESERARLTEELESERARLTEELESERTRLTEELESERARLTEELESERTQGTEQLATAARTAAGEREHVKALSATAKTAQLKVDRLSKKVEELTERIAGRDEKIKELKAAKRESDVQAKALESQIKRIERGAGSTKSAPASKKAAPKKAAPKKAAPKTAARDDLTLISGVGPVLVKKLAKAGIRTFAQIAELKKADIEELADKLGIPASRITREKWVASAAKQAKTAKA